MIVLPGVWCSEVNAVGAAASGRSAPTIGFSRPSLRRRASSASRDRSGSTTKKIERPCLGSTVGSLMMVTSVPPARKCSGTVENLTADDVEDHVDLSGVLQLVGLEVQEGVRSQTERGVAVAGTASSDHHGPHLAGELHGDRTDSASGAVDQDGLACRESSVIDQCLPRGQPGDGQRGGRDVVDVSRKWSEVSGLYRGVLGQGAVTEPVRQSEYPLTEGEAGGSVPQLGDDAR